MKSLVDESAHPGTAPSELSTRCTAAAFSLLIPGAGQFYAGDRAGAAAWLVAVGLGYLLVVPGLVLHLLCVLCAACDPRLTLD
jgi:TM2 domain-containing membrane protein YozV